VSSLRRADFSVMVWFQRPEPEHEAAGQEAESHAISSIEEIFLYIAKVLQG
jgi:hypothetical protein